jgi:hypothetical protein
MKNKQNYNRQDYIIIRHQRSYFFINLNVFSFCFVVFDNYLQQNNAHKNIYYELLIQTYV